MKKWGGDIVIPAKGALLFPEPHLNPPLFKGRKANVVSAFAGMTM
jgi:hypothetical protein